MVDKKYLMDRMETLNRHVGLRVWLSKNYLEDKMTRIIYASLLPLRIGWCHVHPLLEQYLFAVYTSLIHAAGACTYLSYAHAGLH